MFRRQEVLNTSLMAQLESSEDEQETNLLEMRIVDLINITSKVSKNLERYVDKGNKALDNF